MRFVPLCTRSCRAAPLEPNSEETSFALLEGVFSTSRPAPRARMHPRRHCPNAQSREALRHTTPGARWPFLRKGPRPLPGVVVPISSTPTFPNRRLPETGSPYTPPIRSPPDGLLRSPRHPTTNATPIPPARIRSIHPGGSALSRIRFHSGFVIRKGRFGCPRLSSNLAPATEPCPQGSEGITGPVYEPNPDLSSK
ncbi:MAG: hypothetical protein RLZZ142_1196 [Verrucomicrobiota bacterium]|jgi:hypothetical protein